MAEHLRAGATISATARALGLSRDQVRTIRCRHLLGMSLPAWRRSKHS